MLKAISVDAVALTRRRERNFSHASQPVPAEDPQVLQVVGEIASDAFAAKAIVLSAARALQDASDSETGGVFDAEVARAAQVAAAQAKVAIDRFSCATAARLLDVGGASATQVRYGHDRHWRNIRTISTHNPTFLKATAVGDHPGQRHATPAERLLLMSSAPPLRFTHLMSVVVVGNPKPLSRTRGLPELVATKLTGTTPEHVIDVVDLGAALLGWGDPKVAEAKEIVKAADFLVVASPTYKATYTGLLKLFLDQFGAGELGQIPTVPPHAGRIACAFAGTRVDVAPGARRDRRELPGAEPVPDRLRVRDRRRSSTGGWRSPAGSCPSRHDGKARGRPIRAVHFGFGDPTPSGIDAELVGGNRRGRSVRAGWCRHTPRGRAPCRAGSATRAR